MHAIKGTQEGSERNQKCNDNLRLRTLVTSENHSDRGWTTYMIEKVRAGSFKYPLELSGMTQKMC